MQKKNIANEKIMSYKVECKIALGEMTHIIYIIDLCHIYTHIYFLLWEDEKGYISCCSSFFMLC